MIKYILTGGKDRVASDYGQKLAAELHKTLESFKILSCFFAHPAEKWPQLATTWRAWFEEHVGSVAAYDYARPEAFLEQIQRAEVVYLHGGQTKLLRQMLRDFDNLSAAFMGKVVVGSSAGANVLAKNFWSASKQTPHHGLAVLDVNVMVHFGASAHDGIQRTASDWAREERAFQDFIGEGEKILRLPEREIVVVEVPDGH